MKVFDPRPDLTEDTAIWVALLTHARKIDPDPSGKNSLYGILHGIRCAGGRILPKPQGGFYFDLLPVTENGPWSREELRKKWLLPYVNEIKEALHVAVRHVQQQLSAS